MNTCQLMGNLGNDAELKVLNNGNAVLNFSLATSETWKDKESGEKKEKTQWHKCCMYGERAKALAKHLVKGTKVAVIGSIEYRSYEKDGEKRYATDIKIVDLFFAGGGKGKSDSKPAVAGDPDEFANNSPVGDEEIPF